MNCRDMESLILAERDGRLTTGELAALSAHVTGCPGCGQLRSVINETATLFKADVAAVSVPDADVEWKTLQTRRHAPPTKKPRLAPMIWFGVPLAAAAAVAAAMLSHQRPASPVRNEPAPIAATGDANAPAPTMVFVDKDSGWLVVWSTDEGPNAHG